MGSRLDTISYTKSWYNIMKDQYLKFVINNSQNTINIDQMVPRGNYDTPEDLINAINKIYEDFAWTNPEHKIHFPPKLFYEPQSYKIKIRLGVINENNVTDLLYPKFSQFFADLLGLTDSQGRQYPQINLRQSTNKQLTENITVNPMYVKQDPPAAPVPVVVNTDTAKLNEDEVVSKQVVENPK